MLKTSNCNSSLQSTLTKIEFIKNQQTHTNISNNTKATIRKSIKSEIQFKKQ